ncbi:MAG: type II toxin-antitoxin system RelE/ParE family toxin [Anaerolineae bacterium]
MMTPPTIEVVFSQTFLDDIKRLRKKYRHILDDVDLLVDRLRNGETPGDRIPGTGYTTYKVRLKSSDLAKGKRGGFRLIYYLQTTTERFLLTIYAKSEQSDISPDEIAALVRKILSSYN